jgi:hypothetical protein
VELESPGAKEGEFRYFSYGIKIQTTYNNNNNNNNNSIQFFILMCCTNSKRPITDTAQTNKIIIIKIKCL